MATSRHFAHLRPRLTAHQSRAIVASFPRLRRPAPYRIVRKFGILGAIAGVIGTLQATEVLKELIGIGESMSGRLLIYDALSCRFETVNIRWDPDNILNGREANISRLSDLHP